MRKKNKTWLSLVVVGALLASACASANKKLVEAEARLQALYPHVTYEAIRPGPVAGLYEIQATEALFYFAPDRELLLFGEFFTPAGTSLTAERRTELAIVGHSKSLASTMVDADQGSPALVVRQGEPMLTAFVDIHCGHCKTAIDWLTDPVRPGGLEIVFLSRTKADADIAAHAVCAPEHLRSEALRQVFGRGNKQKAFACKGALDQLASQARIAAELGIEATPVFAVKEQVLLGFDPERLGSLLAN